MTKYQEQAQLLDPLLEGLVRPLAGLLHAFAAGAEGGAPPPAATVADASRFLWLLATVRCVRIWVGWGGVGRWVAGSGQSPTLLFDKHTIGAEARRNMHATMRRHIN